MSDNVSHIDLFGLESYLRKIEGNFEDEDSIDESNKRLVSLLFFLVSYIIVDPIHK